MAFSVFVGNMIGSKRTREAREYVKLSVITGVVWGLISGTFMLIFKSELISMLSTSREVNRIVSDSFTILTFYVFIEPLSKVITGVITGLGKQGNASVVTLIGYWVIGIPLTILYICLHHREESIFGIWLGASVSLVFILMLQHWIVHGTNY